MELRLAGPDRRLGMDSTDSGTPSSKERILREAHQAVEAAGAGGDTALDRQILDDLRNATTMRSRTGSSTTGCGTGTAAGTTPATPSAPGCATTRNRFSCSPASSPSAGRTTSRERGAKAAKRHQAVSGYWHSLATLARWCRLRSYLDSAAAHGITALDAIRGALAGNPWLPPLPATS